MTLAIALTLILASGTSALGMYRASHNRRSFGPMAAQLVMALWFGFAAVWMLVNR